jgi:uncharacterized membrane protein (DUF485 family)
MQCSNKCNAAPRYILNTFVQSIGHYIHYFVLISFKTDALEQLAIEFQKGVSACLCVSVLVFLCDSILCDIIVLYMYIYTHTLHTYTQVKA